MGRYRQLPGQDPLVGRPQASGQLQVSQHPAGGPVPEPVPWRPTPTVKHQACTTVRTSLRSQVPDTLWFSVGRPGYDLRAAACSSSTAHLSCGTRTTCLRRATRTTCASRTTSLHWATCPSLIYSISLLLSRSMQLHFILSLSSSVNHKLIHKQDDTLPFDYQFVLNLQSILVYVRPDIIYHHH